MKLWRYLCARPIIALLGMLILWLGGLFILGLLIPAHEASIWYASHVGAIILSIPFLIRAFVISKSIILKTVIAIILGILAILLYSNVMVMISPAWRDQVMQSVDSI